MKGNPAQGKNINNQQAFDYPAVGSRTALQMLDLNILGADYFFQISFGRIVGKNLQLQGMDL